MRITANAAQRGALIVFEGCDRSGKTTVCERLVKHLNDTKQLGKGVQIVKCFTFLKLLHFVCSSETYLSGNQFENRK